MIYTLIKDDYTQFISKGDQLLKQQGYTSFPIIDGWYFTTAQPSISADWQITNQQELLDNKIEGVIP